MGSCVALGKDLEAIYRMIQHIFNTTISPLSLFKSLKRSIEFTSVLAGSKKGHLLCNHRPESCLYVHDR